jgi:hypothetical protein
LRLRQGREKQNEQDSQDFKISFHNNLRSAARAYRQ